MGNKKFYVGLALITVSFLGACSSQQPAPETTQPLSPTPVDSSKEKTNEIKIGIRTSYEPTKLGDLTVLCNQALQRAEESLKEIVAKKSDKALLQFEDAMAEFVDAILPLQFMKDVSTDEKIREEGAICEEKSNQFFVSVSTRKDIYEAVKEFKPSNASETRLLNETLRTFKQNGLALPDKELAEVRELKTELVKLEVQFSKNLNEDNSTVEFTAAELEGVSAAFLASHNKTDDGKYIITTKRPDYAEVMENAKSGETRKRIHFAYENRVAKENTPLMEQAIVLRQKIAKKLGYDTWADAQTDGRMAGNAKTVRERLMGLKEKLLPRYQADLEKLEAMKKELEGPKAGPFTAWDFLYFANQLKKKDYALDDDEIREYFPKDHVMNGLFEVYSKLLGVTFHEEKNASIWAEGVKLYGVYDKKDPSKAISYFYTDLAPREGKYGHAAAFTLREGRTLADGSYSVPISAIVANFKKPDGNKPTLLNHDEVETLFHEFGHIMHQTLTRAPYRSLSGTSVARDFVEAPSQMLESWAWKPEVLNLLSGHYNNIAQKLPQELLNRMLAAKDFNKGYHYMRQILFGTFDLTIHTKSGKVDVVKEFDEHYKNTLLVEPLDGGHFAASFGHLMGGYDAGYYGYIWSEVYAADMFTAFDGEGLLLSPEVGARYRKHILEQGAMEEPLELVRQFLGREPNDEAFSKKLGI